MGRSLLSGQCVRYSKSSFSKGVFTLSDLHLSHPGHQVASRLFTRDLLKAASNKKFFWFAFFVVLCSQRSIFHKDKKSTKDSDDLYQALFKGALLALHDFRGEPIPEMQREEYLNQHGICATAYDRFLVDLKVLWDAPHGPQKSSFTYDEFTRVTSTEDNLNPERIEEFKLWLVEYVLYRTDSCIWRKDRRYYVVSADGTRAIVPGESIFRESIRYRDFWDDQVLFAFPRQTPPIASSDGKRLTFAELAFPVSSTQLLELDSCLSCHTEYVYDPRSASVNFRRVVAGVNRFEFYCSIKKAQKSDEAAAILRDEIVHFLTTDLHLETPDTQRTNDFINNLGRAYDAHAEALKSTRRFIRTIAKLTKIAKGGEHTEIGAKFDLSKNGLKDAFTAVLGQSCDLNEIKGKKLRIWSLFPADDLALLVVAAHRCDSTSGLNALDEFITDHQYFSRLLRKHLGQMPTPT